MNRLTPRREIGQMLNRTFKQDEIRFDKRLMSTEILTGVAIADATTLGGQKLVKTASCSVVKEAFPVSLD